MGPVEGENEGRTVGGAVGTYVGSIVGVRVSVRHVPDSASAVSSPIVLMVSLLSPSSHATVYEQLACVAAMHAGNTVPVGA